MKALGWVSILLALVIVAVLAKKQLAATHQGGTSASATAASQAGVDLPQIDNAADAHRLEDQVKGEVSRMMQERASQVDSGLGDGDAH